MTTLAIYHFCVDLSQLSIGPYIEEEPYPEENWESYQASKMNRFVKIVINPCQADSFFFYYLEI